MTKSPPPPPDGVKYRSTLAIDHFHTIVTTTAALGASSSSSSLSPALPARNFDPGSCRSSERIPSNFATRTKDEFSLSLSLFFFLFFLSSPPPILLNFFFFSSHPDLA